jgi:acyl-CoA synthetase (NDP forming)
MRDLSPLFNPRSVAVLGASSDSAKWGYTVSTQLLSLPSGREIFLVNRSGGEILGQIAYRSLDELPAPVDLVAIIVPAGGFLDAVRDALAAGARALVAITAGLGETGADGLRIEQQAVAMARAAGAVLVGPNCLGVTDSSTGLRLASDRFADGDVTVLSQSGNMVLDLESLLVDAGLGISRFVSLGNQADITVTDVMRDCVNHEGTRAVAIYAEDVKDGREFAKSARALADVGKPVVLLAPGSSEAGRRSAASHTGSLTSAESVIDAACDAAGVRRVHSPLQMVDALAALRQPNRARGRRVAILTDGGGHGSVAADALHHLGLDVPVLSDELGVTLADALWEQSSVTNPVDLAGMGERDPLSYGRGMRALLDSDEVDAVLMTGYFGGYSTSYDVLAGPEIQAAHDIVSAVKVAGKPVVIQSIFPESDSVMVLRSGGLPVHRDISRACAALAVLDDAQGIGRGDALELPAADEPVASGDYTVVRSVLADAGVSFPAAALVTSDGELADLLAAGTIGFPLVMKAMGLLHKSDAGGVLLGITDAETACVAYRDLVQRLAPPAVSVERMADSTDAVEVIVGCTWDPRFGPVLMVGLGGVFTEVMQDVAFALAPVSRDTARSLLLSLRSAPILAGIRGRKPVDLDALVDVVVAVADAGARHREWGELEVNPVIASPSGAIAVDARAVMAS